MLMLLAMMSVECDAARAARVPARCVTRHNFYRWYNQNFETQSFPARLMQSSTGGNPQPGKEDYFLKSARLGFRCWTTEDLPQAKAIWGDSLVTRFVGGPFSTEQVQARLAREIACMNDFGVQYWPIFKLSTGEHVGCAGMRARKPEERIFSMGFYLRPQYWGEGLAVESGAAVISYAFGSLGIRELYAAHHPENFASGKVLAKLGFTFTHKELYPPTGLMHTAYSLKPSSE